ncbi:MAG: hypothetical protein KatS3mg031_0896 [Chitinophagales bacterium]|nr:MAG: hypothetical protein KatS3mg031_0896 [Chitinophagales bacterium]
MPLRSIGLMFFLISANLLTGQELSRLRYKAFAVSGDTLVLDTLSIVEGSLVIRDADNRYIDSSWYEADYLKALLRWKKIPAVDSVWVLYRTYPFSFSRTYYRKDRSMITAKNTAGVNPFNYMPSTADKLIDFGTLQYSGSFARGISFGTNQDVVLSSSFNLQLSGDLGRDVEVTAAITDNNIPIQPDGTTQQLQEFDKVYIQIRKNAHSMIVGDYELTAPESYFMKYYKRLQGGSYSGSFDIRQKNRIAARASLAVAKGKYQRYPLPVTEGNQGPYKLIGANGETFIIVLAGTERVYINGKLMQRGAENDYIMDYNLGEITFTPKQLITSDLRVVVEFEYSENSYFRYLIAWDAAYEREKLKLRVNFFSEQDSKNQPLEADLGPGQRDALRAAGDNPSGILFPGYTEQDFSPDKVLYKLIDFDTTNSKFDTVFVYSTHPDSARYRVIFTYVGPGQGDYVASFTTPNGRVFEYVPPANGQKKGSYIPYRILVPPARKQMITLGLDFNPSKNDRFTAEAALSNHDGNTFSDKGNQDNVGVATRVAYNRQFRIGSASRKQYILADLDYEFAGRNFQALERYRPVEFTRDWNYSREDTTDEHGVRGELRYVLGDWLKLGYQLFSFLALPAYRGLRHRVSSYLNIRGYYLDATISHLTTDAPTQYSRFIRPVVEASKSFLNLRGWKLGGRYELEDNKIWDKDTDTLLGRSFVFTDWRLYIASPDTAVNQMRVEYIRRLEFFPEQNILRLVNASHTAGFRGTVASFKNQRLGWLLTYRRLETADSITAQKEPQDYYLGRVEYSLNVLRGALNFNTLYELGSGKEPRISYSYIQVEPGQGTYQYLGDPNDNPRDESKYVPADQPDKGIYIRVLNPTLDYDDVNSSQFNFSLSLNPAAVWNNKKKLKAFIARFSTVTSLQAERKLFRGSDQSPFNPFVLNPEEQDLVAFNRLARHTVFFNRISPVYSLEYTFMDNARKVNLVNGVESSSVREHLGRVRWNVIRPISVIVKYTFSQRSYRSAVYGDKNYFIEGHEAEPQLAYLYGSKFRVTLLYKFALRNNIDKPDGEKAVMHESSVDARYSVISKTVVNARFSFTHVDYTGNTNEVLEFNMLQGLKDGRNYQWSASFERYLAANIQFSLSYEGRKTGSLKPVHIGRAAVRAIF